MKVKIEAMNKEFRFDCVPKYSHFVYGNTLYFKTELSDDSAPGHNAYSIHQSESCRFPGHTMVRIVTELTAKY